MMRSHHARVRGAVRAGRSAAGVVTIGLLGSILGGCAADPAEKAPPLPLRVAVIPFEAAEIESNNAVGTAPGGEARGRREESAGVFQLHFDESLVRSALVNSLDGRRFTDVILLERPGGTAAEEFLGWSREERVAYWTRLAAGHRANAIMECDFKASRSVGSSINEKFWLNLPLFLLGGPFSYFVNDRSYFTDGRLHSTLHTLDAILDGRATLGDGRAELFRSEVRFSEVSLDFLDRARFHPLPYLASMFVPTAFLAVSNDTVRARVENELAAGLAANVARAIQESSRRILEGEQVADFHLDPRLEILGGGAGITVRGEAVLRQRHTQRLDGFVISAGGRAVRHDFDPGTIDTVRSTERERCLRYPFEARLPREEVAGDLEIELIAGGREKHRRTFTVTLPPEFATRRGT